VADWLAPNKQGGGGPPPWSGPLRAGGGGPSTGRAFGPNKIAAGPTPPPGQLPADHPDIIDCRTDNAYGQPAPDQPTRQGFARPLRPMHAIFVSYTHRRNPLPRPSTRDISGRFPLWWRAFVALRQCDERAPEVL